MSTSYIADSMVCSQLSSETFVYNLLYIFQYSIFLCFSCKIRFRKSNYYKYDKTSYYDKTRLDINKHINKKTATIIYDAVSSSDE